MTSRSCEGSSRPWSITLFQTRNPTRSDSEPTIQSANRHRVRQPNQMATMGAGANRIIEAKRATSSERAKKRTSHPHPQVPIRVMTMISSCFAPWLNWGPNGRFVFRPSDCSPVGRSSARSSPALGSRGLRPLKFDGSNNVSSALQAARSENPSGNHRTGTA